MSYRKQIGKEHYSFERYFSPDRWMSYYYQTKELTSRKDIKTVLDIGPGTTFLKDVLKIHRSDINYKTLDIAEDINPDFLGSITQIPLEDGSFDVVCAFQVLEHIEFSDFEKAIIEMKRVSNNYVFISLPHFGPPLQLFFKVPFLPHIRLSCKIPFHPRHAFNGQHYWEIGKKNYSAKRIREILRDHLDIVDEYVPFENQYHRFFLLKKSE